MVILSDVIGVGIGQAAAQRSGRESGLGTKHGTKSGSSYSASKWGIIGLMKPAALELGAPSITVNAVIPGLIDTALTRHEDRYAQVISEAGQPPGGDTPTDERTAIGLLKASTPLGIPWIEPADVAPLVVFFFRPPIKRRWSAAPHSPSPAAIARTSQPEPAGCDEPCPQDGRCQVSGALSAMRGLSLAGTSVSSWRSGHARRHSGKRA